MQNCLGEKAIKDNPQGKTFVDNFFSNNYIFV